MRSRYQLEFLEIVRWESVPRGSSALTGKLSSRLFSRPDWLPLGLRGWSECSTIQRSFKRLASSLPSPCAFFRINFHGLFTVSSLGAWNWGYSTDIVVHSRSLRTADVFPVVASLPPKKNLADIAGDTCHFIFELTTWKTKLGYLVVNKHHLCLRCYQEQRKLRKTTLDLRSISFLSSQALE